MHAAPTVSELMALSEIRPDEQSQWTRFYQWRCPCGETFVGRSQPQRKVWAKADHAAFVECFREYIEKHMKEHANA